MQRAGFVNRQPHRYRLLIVVLDFVVLDLELICPASVLGRSGMLDVPFYKRGSGDEGDIIQVDDAQGEVEFGLAQNKPKGWSIDKGLSFLSHLVKGKVENMDFLLRRSGEHSKGSNSLLFDSSALADRSA